MAETITILIHVDRKETLVLVVNNQKIYASNFCNHKSSNVYFTKSVKQTSK